MKKQTSSLIYALGGAVTSSILATNRVLTAIVVACKAARVIFQS